MNRRTVGLTDEQEQFLETIQERHDDVESFAEAARLAVDASVSIDDGESRPDRRAATVVERADRVDELRDDLESERARADDLRRQLAARTEREDEIAELVEYAQDERTAAQRRREAGLLTRARWWLSGMPGDDRQ